MGERRTRARTHTHTHTHTHQHTCRQDLSPPHIPKQNTHCVIAPFVFHFHPPLLPYLTLLLLTLVLSFPPSHLSPILPSRCVSLLLQLCVTVVEEMLCLRSDKYVGLFQNIQLILEHAAKYLSCGEDWRMTWLLLLLLFYLHVRSITFIIITVNAGGQADTAWFNTE